MPDYSVLQYLKAAGFKGDALRKAWAVTQRESGGRPDAYNPNRATGDDSYGLFQINMLGNLGPARLKQYGLKSNKDLFDPYTNAKVAYQMSKGGTDWGAWAIGPNAYKGAPADAQSKFQQFYNMWDPSKAGTTPSGPQGMDSKALPAPTEASAPSGRKQAAAQLLGVALNLSSGGSVDSNIFARTMNLTSPKGTVEPPTVKGPTGPQIPEGPNPTINKVLAAAHEQVGKPYVFGSGPDTSSFDCSDLIQYAYKQAGIDIPRVTYDQIKTGQTVAWGQFQPGDLIFSNKGGHVVMYVGNGKVIAAPRTGTVVQYQPVSRFKKSFVTAKRVA